MNGKRVAIRRFGADDLGTVVRVAYYAECRPWYLVRLDDGRKVLAAGDWLETA